ncbi:MAG: LysM peptidoglycan-binding domain-containing protein [Faecalibacterium sp.]
MHVGVNNVNLLCPVAKLKIKNLSSKKSFSVLYNPQSYSIERGVRYSEQAGLDTNAPSVQFINGSAETLHMELFFDSFSAGAEVGGSLADRAKFTGNSVLPSAAKQLDVRKYTSKVYDLMLIDPSLHVPPLLKLEWSSLQFEGHLISCKQNFTKFNERGVPVRAKLDCVFRQYIKPSEIAKLEPVGSPDTAKFRTVCEGDSLWAIAAREYGQSSLWREIARVNGIENPRQLETGMVLQIPAL